MNKKTTFIVTCVRLHGEKSNSISLPWLKSYIRSKKRPVVVCLKAYKALLLFFVQKLLSLPNPSQQISGKFQPQRRALPVISQEPLFFPFSTSDVLCAFHRFFVDFVDSLTTKEERIKRTSFVKQLAPVLQSKQFFSGFSHKKWGCSRQLTFVTVSSPPASVTLANIDFNASAVNAARFPANCWKVERTDQFGAHFFPF